MLTVTGCWAVAVSSATPSPTGLTDVGRPGPGREKYNQPRGAAAGSQAAPLRSLPPMSKRLVMAGGHCPAHPQSARGAPSLWLLQIKSTASGPAPGTSLQLSRLAYTSPQPGVPAGSGEAFSHLRGWDRTCLPPIHPWWAVMSDSNFKPSPATFRPCAALAKNTLWAPRFPHLQTGDNDHSAHLPGPL